MKVFEIICRRQCDMDYMRERLKHTAMVITDADNLHETAVNIILHSCSENRLCKYVDCSTVLYARINDYFTLSDDIRTSTDLHATCRQFLADSERLAPDKLEAINAVTLHVNSAHDGATEIVRYICKVV